jgi:hypothetical protein
MYMTMAIYDIQAASAAYCTSAYRAYSTPRLSVGAEIVKNIALARLKAFEAFAKSIFDLTLLTWFRIIKGCTAADGENSKRAFSRKCIAVSLAVTLVVFRLVISFGGVILPEVTFHLVRAHRLLLWAGLTCRSQLSDPRRYISTHGIRPSMIDTQRWRHLIVRKAVAMIDNDSSDRWQTGFDVAIWRRAERAAADEEYQRLRSKGSVSCAGSAACASPPPAARARIAVRPPEESSSAVRDFLPPDLQGIPESFWNPVRVPHPLLDAFYDAFASRLHPEVEELCRQNIYTQAELSDICTALKAVVYRALAKTVVATLVVSENVLVPRRGSLQSLAVTVHGNEERYYSCVRSDTGQRVTVCESMLPCGVPLRLVKQMPKEAQNIRPLPPVSGQLSYHELSWVDKREISNQNAGGIADWKAQLIELRLLIESLSEDEYRLLPQYLCADDERVRACWKGLPNRGDYPVIDRCFRLIVQFAVDFVEPHMHLMRGNVLQAAFVL